MLEREIALSFGQWVREHREALGWSQELLAEKMGYEKTYISHIELGRASRVSFVLMLRTAEALGQVPARMLRDLGLWSRVADGTPPGSDELAELVAFAKAWFADITPVEKERIKRSMAAARDEPVLLPRS